MHRVKQLLAIVASVLVFSCAFGTLPQAPRTTGHTYDLVEPQELLGPSSQTVEFNTLARAKQGDTCIFELAGIGGRVDSLMLLIRAIHTTKCFVIMHVRGNVYSSHAYLALAGDSLIIDKGAFLMYHDVQMGKGGHDSIQDRYYRTYFQKYMSKMFGAYLTPAEFNFMFTNPLNELYITGEVMNQRFAAAHNDATGITPPHIRMIPLDHNSWAELVYLPQGSVLTPKKAIT